MMLRCCALFILAALCGRAVAADGQPPCAACHQEQASVRNHPAPEPAAELPAAGLPACTDCHVDAGNHPAPPPAGEAGGMMVFTSEPPGARAAACGSCHRGVHTGEAGDLHRQSGLACDDCHRIHGPADAKSPALPAGLRDVDEASATCAGCHHDVFAEFAFNERHRLAEGVVSCVSCHDPHDVRPRSLLSHPGEDACGECHQDKVGPFVFEHAASRVDGCLACHEPHGSPNRHLLTHQREGELCYTCHATVPQFHVGFGPAGPPRFDQDTVCTNCHTAIHGSNLDRDFLR